ncbi:MAG: aminotransferase class V-fold PLP-dependent enzyme [Bacteroidales bacterium]|jgi:selenocysteine lyase/cysteine desulfurase|nr:aminotransferase class V-fold PLP-dependent enzyme [Bacteroidales bacterium]
MSTLERYFEKFRKNIVGVDSTYISPFGEMKISYADWIASGRLYKPIEEKILKEFGPFVANTHTETSETGTRMTHSYHHAQEIIKNHVNAGPNDVLIQAGFGMTSVINKMQRILGFKYCGLVNNKICLKEVERPVVFITHMEHHSNQTSWYETIAEVVVLEPDKDMRVNPKELRKQLEKYKNRKIKIGSFTAASNVTGIITPYHELAKIMHEHGGLCFIDFAASAPYVDMDMHPDDPKEKLDAILFSPHKFLGGPGTAGIMIFDSNLYDNDVPDNPGGGTVDWTNRWGEHKYIDDIEVREDGGTPGFLQAIRSALTIKLKEQMGTKQIAEREKEIVPKAISELKKIKGIKVLAENIPERIGSISFYHVKIHFNFIVKSLSDRFGIQVRGGCACAGTYGHYMLHVSKEESDNITKLINSGDLSKKPGWVRWSIHPTTRNQEIDDFVNAINQIVNNYEEWIKDYNYNKMNNEFYHKNFNIKEHFNVKSGFVLD